MSEEFVNKDLESSKQKFYDSITNDFIGNDFEEQLEWAMIMISGKFKQIRFAEYLPYVTANHFDKAYLISSGEGTLNDKLKFFKPFTDLQVSPDIFPLINHKSMTIGETVQLHKVKELDNVEKRKLRVKRKYAYQISTAFYNKTTEDFYGIAHGYEINPQFFNIGNTTEDKRLGKLGMNGIPIPLCLHPGWYIPTDSIKYLSDQEIIEVMYQIALSYQIAFSMYYEWCIYIKEYDNLGLVIPIEPMMLHEIYKTSMMKFPSTKKMIHFVREHYRRKVAIDNADYSVYVHKYLRGEYKFDYKSFRTEIIPPRYDLNRVRTKKQFVKPEEDAKKIIY